MKLKKVVDSFNHAINGIIDTVRTQRNMKIHLVAAIGVLIACFCFDISKMEFLIIAITVAIVIAAELINTAIEAAIDMTTNYYHPLAKIAKNAAAGAVLVTAINAIVVGYVIFWDKLSNISYEVIHKVKNNEPYTIFIVLVIVSFATITAIALITEEPTCIMLSYIMAFITAQSRVDSEVHTLSEVIVGAIFGMLITLLIFTIFKL